MALLLLFLGVVGGAMSRHLIERTVQTRRTTPLPWGGFVVSAAGCFVLGILTGLAYTHDMPTGTVRLLGAAITAFSIFGYETMRLLEDRQPGKAGLHALGGWAAGTAAATVGVLVAMS
ncbi:CrcB family protein [Streptomyces mirabilis]|uniref:fluoride efflux transporter FluC n=1 Tax=Streptomyces sp. NPDC005388 TaxID=3156717 RepID=UPI0033BC6D49